MTHLSSFFQRSIFFRSPVLRSPILRSLGLLGSLFIGFLSFSVSVQAAPNKVAIATNLSMLGINVSDVAESPINGLYQVTTQHGLFYTTATGDHFIQGSMYGFDKSGQLIDYTKEKNLKDLNALEKEMIIFKATNEKHVITVFTDITCGYCLKLHKELKQYLDQGITVRYLAFPRSGPNSANGNNMAKVWCANDRKTALDKAKLDKTFDFKGREASQCQAEIERHYNLGSAMGVRGTPSIILEDGSMVGGYVPADKLIQEIEKRLN